MGPFVFGSGSIYGGGSFVATVSFMCHCTSIAYVTFPVGFIVDRVEEGVRYFCTPLHESPLYLPHAWESHHICRHVRTVVPPHVLDDPLSSI